MKRFSTMVRKRSASIRQRGYSLVELSIALAIVSVVIVGSLIGVQRILANNRANSLLADVPRINAALLGAISNSKGGLTTLTTSQSASLGAFAETAVTWDANKETATVSNAFGGNIYTLGLADDLGEVKAGRGYVVRMTQIPKDMCATVANGLVPLARGIWIDSAADDKSTSTPGENNTVKDLKADSSIALDKLVQNCQASDTRTINALIVL